LVAGFSAFSALFAGKLISSPGQAWKKEIKTSKAPAAIGPYSQGIRADNFLFLSGQIPIDPSTGKLVNGGVKKQAVVVFENIKAVLKAANADFSNVVKATVFLKNLDNYSVVNQIYASYFEAPFPARAAVEVARLPKDVEIEVEVIAYSKI